MKEIIMNASIIAAIIVVGIGLIKSPLIKYKEKAWYKPLLTIITIVLTLGLCVLDQLYILKDGLLTWNFVILIAITFGEIYSTYHLVYEGIIKNPLHNLIDKIKAAKADPNTNTAKAIEKFEKAVSKAVGIDTDTLVKIVLAREETPTSQAEENTVSTEPSNDQVIQTESSNTAV